MFENTFPDGWVPFPSTSERYTSVLGLLTAITGNKKVLRDIIIFQHFSATIYKDISVPGNLGRSPIIPHHWTTRPSQICCFRVQSSWFQQAFLPSNECCVSLQIVNGAPTPVQKKKKYHRKVAGMMKICWADSNFFCMDLDAFLTTEPRSAGSVTSGVACELWWRSSDQKTSTNPDSGWSLLGQKWNNKCFGFIEFYRTDSTKSSF